MFLSSFFVCVCVFFSTKYFFFVLFLPASRGGTSIFLAKTGGTPFTIFLPRCSFRLYKLLLCLITGIYMCVCIYRGGPNRPFSKVHTSLAVACCIRQMRGTQNCWHALMFMMFSV